MIRPTGQPPRARRAVVAGVAAPGPAAPGAVPAPRSVGRSLLQAGPVAVAGFVTNAANVLVTVALARLLTTRGYGALNQLNGLYLVVSLPGTAVSVAVVRRAAAWTAGGTGTRVRRWAARAHRRGLVAVACFAAATLLAGEWVAGALRQPGAAGLDAMVVAGAVWILLCLDRGLLQAHRDYRALATNLLVEGGMRAVAVVGFVAAGLGVPGAAAGVLVAELVTAAHARFAADRAWASTDGRAGVPVPTAAGPPGRADLGTDAGADVRGDRRHLVADLGAALVALATVAWLQNVDVIVLGREAPGEAGAYAAVSVASKALVLAAVVLGGYLLPEAALRWRDGEHAMRQLGATLLFLAVPAACLLAVAVGAPRLLLRIVFSTRYLGAEAAFAPLVVAMIFLAVSAVLVLYLLAIGRREVAIVLVAGAAAATVAVAAAHGHAAPTARADLVVQAALCLALSLELVVAHRGRLR